MDYGRALRIARAFRNLSQKELAQRTELDASYISLLEKNRRSPSREAQERISKVLGVPASLMTLLSADEAELQGITEDQAKEVGQTLITLLDQNMPLFADKD